MPIEITAAEASANILAHVAKKRLVRCSGLPGEWRLRQNWLDPVSLLEAIHMDIKGSGDCPVSLMPRWLADCSFELSNGIAKKDIYPLAERYGKLLAADAMANTDDTLRDRWLVFVVKEALASARQIAITNTSYWRLTEASCELTITALTGKRWLRSAATKAAQAAQEVAQSAAREAEHRVSEIPVTASSPWPIPAQAEVHSAEAAKAAAEAAAAAADAEQAALAGKSYLPQWAARRAAEAARQAALGWMVAACVIGGRDQAAAESAGEAALDAYFEKVNHHAHFEMISAMSSESIFPENAYRRMFDRLLDEIVAAKRKIARPR